MKVYATLALIVVLSGVSSLAGAAGAPKFCMKKFLASQSLHPNPATNVYAQNLKDSDSTNRAMVDQIVGRRR